MRHHAHPQQTAVTLLFAFSLTLAGLAAGAALPGPDEPRVITIPAAKSFLNYSFGSGPDVIFSASAAAGPAGLVTDGDLLAIECSAGEASADMVLVPYRDSDGDVLEVELADGRLLLDGRTVALAGDGQAWYASLRRALESVGTRGLGDLRLLRLSAAMPPEARLTMAELAAENAEIDVLVVAGLPACENLLALFRPRMIVIEDATAGDLGRLRGSPVRSLMLCDAESLDLSPLRHLPELRTLVLMPSQNKGTVRLPRQGLSLERLLIWGDNLEGIAHLDAQRSLRQLVVMDMPERALKQVERLPCLDTLMIGLGDGDRRVDLGAVGDISGLKTLGLRGKVAQADFERLVAGNPGLQVLELIACEDVVDPSAVRWLPNLRVLVCRKTTVPEPEVLGELTQLQLLALDSDQFEEGKAEHLLGLSERLPGCRVASVRGMCLGSGWILLLLPLTVAARLAVRLRENRRAVRPR